MYRWRVPSSSGTLHSLATSDHKGADPTRSTSVDVPHVSFSDAVHHVRLGEGDPMDGIGPTPVEPVWYEETKPIHRPHGGNQLAHTNYLSRPRSVSPSGRERSRSRDRISPVLTHLRSRSPDRARPRSLSPILSPVETRPMPNDPTHRISLRSPRAASPPSARARGRGQSVAYGQARSGSRFRD
jgi:hypothetical protein